MEFQNIENKEVITIPLDEEPTFKKVWLLFQDLHKQSQETSRQMQQTDRQIQEIKELMSKSSQKTDAEITRLSKLYGGVSENSKDVAEEFFFRGLKKRKNLFGIEYEQIDSLHRRRGKTEGQYDIVLYNGSKIIVIEVKYKLHPNDVDDFYNRKLPNFRKLFPEHHTKQIIGGVAGLSVPNESEQRALNYGFLVLTQSGKNLSVLNQPDFKLKTY